MATPTVYVICDQNCKFEGMTKEQILTAIMQAVSTGEIKDVDTGFITTIKTINGLPLRFFVGEQSAYDALSAEDKENLYPIITNDTTQEGIETILNQLITNDKDLENAIQSLDIAVAAKNTVGNLYGFVNLKTSHLSETSTGVDLYYMHEGEKKNIFLERGQQNSWNFKIDIGSPIVCRSRAMGELPGSRRLEINKNTCGIEPNGMTKTDIIKEVYDSYSVTENVIHLILVRSGDLILSVGTAGVG